MVNIVILFSIAVSLLCGFVLGQVYEDLSAAEKINKLEKDKRELNAALSDYQNQR
ncbi:hypothetical protein [Jeotgalibaca porci]|uniref:hypothetical protein n=1 Tax=Jeotgalibaca porci TaxID=1868793 RepID=UPI0035A0FE95